MIKRTQIKLFLLLFYISLYSCERFDSIIHYQYNGVTITRLDKDAVSYFYYGNFSKESDLPEEYIEASYRGFDGIMEGYLVFLNDKKVAIVPTTYFEQKAPTADLFLKEYENPDYINWVDSISGRYKNIVAISHVIKLEKQRNQKNHSKVLVSYE